MTASLEAAITSGSAPFTANFSPIQVGSINSIEWDCEDVTGILIDMNNFFGVSFNEHG